MPDLTRFLCPLIAGFSLAGSAFGDEEPRQAAAPLPASVWNFADWKLDRVTLRSGKVLEGLIESETASELRLLEILRPERRGMFAVRRPLPQTDISQITRATAQQRQESRERFDAFIHRGRVEAVQMESVRLESFEGAGGSGWRYHGDWFTLESHASEELTRVFAMRVEQMFAAYLHVVPPRMSRRDALRIKIFGTSKDFQAEASSLGVTVRNAAFYHPPRNLVVAGSELSTLSAQLDQIEGQHRNLKAQLQQIKRQANAARTSQNEIARIEREIKECDRQNEKIFQQRAGDILSLLSHEAFHAYLENYVYPQSQYDVPRWLNEGLAQVFEGSQLEGGTLRVDLPSKSAMALLTADTAGQTTSLANVLSADYRSFLVPHDAAQGNQKNYAYAWGLAYYLTFARPVLGTPAMDDYVAADAASSDPLSRFERLVGQPLDEFETQWRGWVLAQKGNKGTRSSQGNKP